MEKEKLWIVRALGGDLIPFFTENNLVALGWERINDFTGKNREYIKRLSRIPIFYKNFRNILFFQYFDKFC
jgi:hypothetical protein